jgi:hypothetical protein
MRRMYLRILLKKLFLIDVEQDSSVIGLRPELVLSIYRWQIGCEKLHIFDSITQQLYGPK